MCPKKKLKSCIQLAASKLDDNNGIEDRIFDRIRDFIILLTEDQYSGMSSLLSLAVFSSVHKCSHLINTRSNTRSLFQ